MKITNIANNRDKQGYFYSSEHYHPTTHHLAVEPWLCGYCLKLDSEIEIPSHSYFAEKDYMDALKANRIIDFEIPPEPQKEVVVEQKAAQEKVIEKEEIEHEEPVAAPTAQEIYAPATRPTAYIPDEEENHKKRKPMNIPEPKPVKATKEKGNMKLKFYKEPTARVMKKLMSLHEESSSEEEEEEVKPAPTPQPTREDAKKAYMKQMANYMFDYY